MRKPNLKRLLVVALTLISIDSFAQSLTFDDLKVATRCHKVLTNNMLVNKGFKEGGFKTSGSDTVTFYNKGLTSDASYNESCVTGFTLQGPVDKKKHMTVTYMSRSPTFMLDFTKQIPDDMVLKSKDNGVYSFENTEMYLQITISEDPKKNPYSVYILEKNSYQF